MAFDPSEGKVQNSKLCRGVLHIFRTGLHFFGARRHSRRDPKGFVFFTSGLRSNLCIEQDISTRAPYTQAFVYAIYKSVADPKRVN